jgi:dipeptidyl-peptidase-4
LFLFCVSRFSGSKNIGWQIYGGFRAQGMDELQSMKNTNQCTVLNLDRSRTMQIDLYDYATLKNGNFNKYK